MMVSRTRDFRKDAADHEEYRIERFLFLLFLSGLLLWRGLLLLWKTNLSRSRLEISENQEPVFAFPADAGFFMS